MLGAAKNLDFSLDDYSYVMLIHVGEQGRPVWSRDMYGSLKRKCLDNIDSISVKTLLAFFRDTLVSLSRRNIDYRYCKVLNDIDKHLGIFMSNISATRSDLDQGKTDIPSCFSSRTGPSRKLAGDFYSRVLVVINFFKTVIFFHIINHSSFNSHRRLYAQYKENSVYYNSNFSTDLDSNYAIYHIVSTHHTFSYRGRTNRGFALRTAEHMRLIASRKKEVHEIPAYSLMRRLGFGTFTWIPFIVLKNSNIMEMSYLERQCISKYRDQLNTPFIYRHLKTDKYRNVDNSNNMIFSNSRPVQSRKPFHRPRSSKVVWESSSPLVLASSKGWELEDLVYKSLKGRINLGILALRMGDPRRKCDNTIAISRSLGHPALFTKLSSLIFSYHRGKPLFVARGRLEKAMLHCPHSPSRKSLILDIPYAQGVNTFKIVRNFLSKEVPPILPAHTTINVSFKWFTCPTIKGLLDNCNRWAELITHKPFPCTCKVLQKRLWKPGVDEKPSGSHCVFRLSQCNHPPLPINFSASSPIVLSLRDFYQKIVKEVSRIGELCRSTLPLAKLYEAVSSKYLSNLSNGVIYRHFTRFYSTLKNIAVITPIDKCKSDVALCCPFGWQKRTIELALGSPHTSIFRSHDFYRDARELESLVSYSGVKINRSKHVWGLFRTWVKDSGIFTKMRPLGSYFKHCFRNLFSLACKVINFVVLKIGSNYSTVSAASVISRTHEFNIQSLAFAGRNMYPIFYRWKRDFDNFFNNVDRGLIMKAWDWFVSRWQSQAGSRRMYIRIPKSFVARGYKTPSVVLKRSFKGYARNLAVSNDSRLVPCIINSKSCTHEYYVLDIRHIKRIILHDLVFGFLKLGSMKFAPLKGTTQGSPLAPGVCLMVSAYLEAQKYSLCRPVSCEFGLSILSRMRWVDDLFVMLVVWTSYDEYNNTDVRSDIDTYALSCLNSVLNDYNCWFRMKEEDPSVFVGLSLDWNGSSVDIMNHSHNDISINNMWVDRLDGIFSSLSPLIRPRFQYGVSSSPPSRVATTIFGQAVAILDRSSSENPEKLLKIISVSLRNLALEFLFLNYNPTTVLSSYYKVVRRHPYLRSHVFSALREVSWFLNSRVYIESFDEY